MKPIFTPPSGDASDLPSVDDAVFLPGANQTGGNDTSARSSGQSGKPADNLGMIMRIPVTIKAVLGSAVMPVAQLVRLGRGAIIPLDRRVGEPVDVVVNGQVVARGEVVVLDENGSRFGISLTEVMTRDSRSNV